MITSERSENILSVAAIAPADRYEFESAFPSRRFYHNFNDTIMRSVRALTKRGLLKRKKRGVYVITKEGRKAAVDYNLRLWRRILRISDDK